MKKLLPIALITIVFIGCSKSNPSNALVGKWVLDSVHQTAIDSAVYPPSDSLLSTFFGDSTNFIQFNSNNTFSVTQYGMVSYTGTYSTANGKLTQINALPFIQVDTSIEMYTLTANTLITIDSSHQNQSPPAHCSGAIDR